MELTPRWSGIFARLLILTLGLTAFWVASDAHWLSVNLHGIGWIFLSSLLTIATLAILATASRLRGWPLISILAVTYFGVGYINVFDELLIFNLPGVTQRIAIRSLADGLLITAIFVPLLVWSLGRMSPGDMELQPAIEARRVGAWMWRVLVGAVLYVFFYFVAGFAIFPFVKSFYAHAQMPALGSVVGLEVFRGLVYVAIVIVATRAMVARRLRAALAMGLALSVFGGVGPLLLPNPIMPSYVRLAHGFEVGISNFVYGMILGWLSAPRGKIGSGTQPEPASARA